jgi:CheY-like chemotaxis protein
MTAAKFILVADDDEPSREGLKLLLSRWGYAAETSVAARTPRWSRALVRTPSHGRRHDHRTRTW